MRLPGHGSDEGAVADLPQVDSAGKDSVHFPCPCRLAISWEFQKGFFEYLLSRGFGVPIGAVGHPRSGNPLLAKASLSRQLEENYN